ncbi:hypothetical protein V4S31_04665 [Enterococcus cecorum]
MMPLVVVRKVHTEEGKSRLGYLVVHRVSRGKIYLSTLFLSLVFGLLAIALNGASLGIAAVSSMKEENYDFVWTCLKAAMNQWYFSVSICWFDVVEFKFTCHFWLARLWLIRL